jgi:hypothetical protein
MENDLNTKNLPYTVFVSSCLCVCRLTANYGCGDSQFPPSFVISLVDSRRRLIPIPAGGNSQFPPAGIHSSRRREFAVPAGGNSQFPLAGIHSSRWREFAVPAGGNSQFPPAGIRSSRRREFAVGARLNLAPTGETVYEQFLRAFMSSCLILIKSDVQNHAVQGIR